MGLAFGSTNPCVILQSQAGSWIHPPIHSSTHPHSHSSSQIFHPPLHRSTHLSSHPFRVHTSIHPPVHSFIQPPFHTTSYPSFHTFLFTFLHKPIPIYTLSSSPSIHPCVCSSLYPSSYISTHHFIHILIYTHIRPFFLGHIYTLICANSDPLFPIYLTQ